MATMITLWFGEPTKTTPLRTLRSMARATYGDQAVFCFLSATSLYLALLIAADMLESFERAVVALPVVALNGYAAWRGWGMFDQAIRLRHAIYKLIEARQKLEGL